MRKSLSKSNQESLDRQGLPNNMKPIIINCVDLTIIDKDKYSTSRLSERKTASLSGVNVLTQLNSWNQIWVSNPGYLCMTLSRLGRENETRRPLLSLDPPKISKRSTSVRLQGFISWELAELNTANRSAVLLVDSLIPVPAQWPTGRDASARRAYYVW